MSKQSTQIYNSLRDKNNVWWSIIYLWWKETLYSIYTSKFLWPRDTSNILSKGRKGRKKCLSLGYKAQHQAENNIKCKKFGPSKGRKSPTKGRNSFCGRKTGIPALTGHADLMLCSSPLATASWSSHSEGKLLLLQQELMRNTVATECPQLTP